MVAGLQVVLLLLCVCAYSVTGAGILYTSTTLVVGVVWPYSASPVASIAAPLSLAQQDVQANFNVSLILRYMDSGNTPAGVVAGVMSLYSTTTANTSSGSTLVALIGEASSANTIPMAVTGTAITTLVLTPTSSSTTLSDTTTYKYFQRLTYTDAYAAMAVKLLLNRYNWYIAAIIYSDDDDGRGLLTALLNNPIAGAQLSIHSLPANSSIAEMMIPSVLTDIQSTGTRIIILHGSQIVNVLRAAYSTGLLGNPNVWIGLRWCTADTIAALSDLPGNPLLGTLCIAQTQPTSSKWPVFTARLNAANPAMWPDVNNVDPMYGNMYDTLYTLGSTIGSLTASNTPYTASSLLSNFNNANVSGVTGQVQFPLTSVGRTRSASYSLVSFDASSQSYVISGSWSSTSNATLLVTGNIQWSTGQVGDGGYPKDRPSLYVQGDDLPSSSDGRILVLSYAMATLGAWTSLVLLEQAISMRVRSPGSWKSGLGWLSAASFALAVCCQWALHFLAVTSISLPTISLSLDTVRLLLSPLLSVALTMPALWLCLTDMAEANRLRIECSTHSSASTTHLSKSSDISHMKAGSKSQRNEEEIKARRIWRTFHLKMAGKTAVASVLLGLNSSILFELANTAIIGQCDVSVSGGRIAGNFVFVGSLMSAALWPMFHFHRSAFRFLSAFVASGIVLGGQQIAYDGNSYTMDFNTGDSSYSLVPVSNATTLVLAGVVGALCALLMLINVMYLRSARQTLDKIVKRVRTQVSHIEKSTEEDSRRLEKVEAEIEWARRALEIIGLCRPMYRPHALAIALAEVEIDTTQQTLSNDALQLSTNGWRADGDDESAASRNTTVSFYSDNSLLPTTASRQSTGASIAESEGSDPTLHRDSWVTPGSVSVSSTAGNFRSVHCVKSTQSIRRLLSRLLQADGGNPAGWLSTPLIASDSGTSSSNPSKGSPKLNPAAGASGGSVSQANGKGGMYHLKQCLSNVTIFELLKDVMAANFSSESVMLWCDIQRYRVVRTERHGQALADAIHSTFIVDGAQYQVNISSTMRDRLTAAIREGRYNSELFDEVEREIQSLIATNHLDQLLHSQTFAIVQQVMPAKDAIGGASSSTWTEERRLSAAETKSSTGVRSTSVSVDGRRWQAGTPIESANVSGPRAPLLSRPSPSSRARQFESPSNATNPVRVSKVPLNVLSPSSAVQSSCSLPSNTIKQVMASQTEAEDEEQRPAEQDDGEGGQDQYETSLPGWNPAQAEPNLLAPSNSIRVIGSNLSGRISPSTSIINKIVNSDADMSDEEEDDDSQQQEQKEPHDQGEQFEAQQPDEMKL